MLKNDPPSGTRIRFLQSLRKVAADETGTLVRPLRKYLTESADDQFEVNVRGEIIVVSRSQIVEVNPSAHSL
jgi:hypothetical protein